MSILRCLFSVSLFISTIECSRLCVFFFLLLLPPFVTSWIYSRVDIKTFTETSFWMQITTLHHSEAYVNKRQNGAVCLFCSALCNKVFENGREVAQKKGVCV